MADKNKCKLGKKFNAGLCTIRHNAENVKRKSGKPYKEECIKCGLYKKYINNKDDKKTVIDLSKSDAFEAISVVNNDINTVNIDENNDNVTSKFIDLTAVGDSRNGVDDLIQKYNDIVKSAKKAYDETIEKAEKIKSDIDKYSRFLDDLKYLKNNS